MAAQQLLKWFLVLFGAVCTGIGLLHIVLGPAAIPGSIPVNATLDNEDRFFGTLFLGFGLAHVWAGQDLRHRRGIILALQAVFFAGGLARVISILAAGPPHPLFLFLGGLELVIPPAVWWGLRYQAMAPG